MHIIYHNNTLSIATAHIVCVKYIYILYSYMRYMRAARHGKNSILLGMVEVSWRSLQTLKSIKKL